MASSRGTPVLLTWRSSAQIWAELHEQAFRRLTDTKTYTDRRVPVSANLRAVLSMRRTAPDGRELGPDRHVFGNEVGEPIGSIRTTWRATCRRAKIADLHFHHLRREFASRLLESGASQRVVRDFLGHASITTTSRYLATTPTMLEHAIKRFERSRSDQQPKSGEEMEVTGTTQDGTGHADDSHNPEHQSKQ
jgi:integrase